ncbi:acetylserotonin O-methyltransferase [Halomarina rubra]|uniref:Methyltransferase n=1 Tax=Halomarina rubra TaxID=2071873 RepID=A0ABD6AYM6_9EURY|nr:acetylserotonin O-methyltransferase [Halomarina rubra]
MPVVPNTLERLAMLRLNRAPGPVLDMVAAGAFRAATTAYEHGVFAELRDGPRTAFDLAQTLDAHEDGLRPLLDFLVTTGYLDRDGIYYENSTMTTRWLTDAPASTDVGPWLAMWETVVFPFWTTALDDVLATGEPDRTLYETLTEDPEAASAVQRGFVATAELALDGVLDAVAVPEGATRLLDVGGGHGRYAAAFVATTPTLTATVFDRPEAAAVAREVAAANAVGDRVRFEAGDYFADDLGSDYDLALVFNVLHAHDPEENRRLLARVHDALGSGGRIAVLDQFASEARTPAWEAALAFLNLNYHITIGAGIPDEATVPEWLTDAGFRAVRRESVGPGIAVFVAERD